MEEAYWVTCSFCGEVSSKKSIRKVSVEGEEKKLDMCLSCRKKFFG